MVAFIRGIFGGKSPVNSMTAWGLVIWHGLNAALGSAVDGGLLSEHAVAVITAFTVPTGQVLTALGIRRAANK